MPNHSIYDGQRLALPDEVWNFGRGDGIEKALLLADFIVQRNPSSKIAIEINHNKVKLNSDDTDYNFESQKNFRKSINISGDSYIIN